MNLRRVALLLAIVPLFLADLRATEKEEKKPPGPTGWCYVAKEAVDAKSAPSDRRKTILHLGRGALVPAFDARQARGLNWTKVRVVDPAKLTSELAWVESSKVETLPPEQFPVDAEILKLLGGSYLEDDIAANATVARILVRQGGGEPALACFVGSTLLPQTRLQVFLRSPRGFALGPSLEFPFSEIQAGISSLEVLNLLGDGNECLVTHEEFNFGRETRGVNVVIRKIEPGAFRTLWKAPIEFSSLASFPPKVQTLAPPERNIGIPGTVTKGEVEFRARGRVSEPVWRGKIEIHALGREEPVETLKLEKVCAWDGTRFAPLQ